MYKKRKHFLAIATLASLVPAIASHAQSNIDPAHKFAWGENIGWTNWYDAGNPTGSQGVKLCPLYAPDFLQGYVWGENVGWLDLGNGSPTGAGNHYLNTNGTNYGVNVAPNGNLSGFAWGENVGWVNFSGGALASPAQPARYVALQHRFRGYIWGENIGWINLEDNVKYVGVCCPADFDCDGFLTGIDYDLYVQAFQNGDPAADFDCDGFVTGADFDLYVQAFDGGC